MDEFELCEPTFSVCNCCGTRATRLTRFVSRDGKPWAVYYAAFCETPDRGYVSVLAGFGGWTPDEPEGARTAFAFQLRPTREGVATSIVGPAETVWETPILGRVLTRDEALDHPLRRELFRLSDEILERDGIVLARVEAIHAAAA